GPGACGRVGGTTRCAFAAPLRLGFIWALDFRCALGENGSRPPLPHVGCCIVFGVRSAGGRFREAVAAERPLQVVGCVYAYAARMAERVGFKAIYLSGGGVAAGSLGVPDLGITTLEDVLTDVRRITGVTGLPLLVDADTGFGGAFNIARTVR